MRIKRLVIKNIGILADVDLALDKPLNLFFGDLRAGKSTILNAVRWAFGGAFPSDIIKHGQEESKVIVEFDTARVERSWYRAKDGVTKAREISFIRDGKPVKPPQDGIKKLLNPFLINQDFLRNMGETDRKQYFVDFFGVDTKKEDAEAVELESEARDLRAKIKGYGLIDLTEIKRVDPAPLQKELALIRGAYKKECDEIEDKNKKVIQHNAALKQAEGRSREIDQNIKEMEEKISDLRNHLSNVIKFIVENPRQEEEFKSDAPNTCSLESKISESVATNVRAEQYQKNLKRATEKKFDERILLEAEARLREIKKEKAGKLKKVSDTCQIKGLAFDELGNFVYEGTQAGMLSTSQIMKLSSELSDLYPEGFSLDLIDRAESLGKSIFTFIERAQRDKRTILATIVGDKPAVSPPEIGIWVVESGEVKS